MLSTRALHLAGLLVSWILLAAQGHAAQTPSQTPHPARVEIKRTVRAVESILEEDKVTMETRRRKVMAEIRRTVDAHVVSKLVLADNLSRFSRTQREEFEDEFLRHVLFSYWNHAHRFERFEVLGDKRSGSDWIVRTRLHAEKDVTQLDYRLRRERPRRGAPKTEPTWKIIDIRIDGASIVSSFRDQFESLLSRGNDPESVLKLLRKKNAKSEAEANRRIGS